MGRMGDGFGAEGMDEGIPKLTVMFKISAFYTA